MKIKFFLHGQVPVIMEWTVPEPAQMNFMGLCKSIRADGYFLSDTVYIPHDQIQAIGVEGANVIFPTAPSTETKQ